MNELLVTLKQDQALWEHMNPGKTYTLPPQEKPDGYFYFCEHGYEWDQGHECQQMREYLEREEKS